MYERAFRSPAERSAFAGVFVVAVALSSSLLAPAATAQTIGRPNVIVDDSVLDQLGPPPQTLPDVLLQQQPQAYRPASRDSTASTAPAQGRLLPPPSTMPRSRITLPGGMQPVQSERAPAAAQTARAPKAAPLPKVERSDMPAAADAPSAPTVVPPTITPPTVSVPEAPAITPPPTLPTPEVAERTPAAPPAPMPSAPVAPPVAKTEATKPAAAAPSVPTIVPPAPREPERPVAAQPEPSAPSGSAAAPLPSVEPPAPPGADAAPAPSPDMAAKAPSPRTVRPIPQITDAPASPQVEKPAESGGDAPGAAQIASLPPSTPPEVLEDGQLYRIPFGTVSSDISDDGKKYLDELAQRLKKDSALRIQLLGYAGSTQDSASKARRTSLFRALSVRTYLMKQGIRSTRMDVRALGNMAEGGVPDRVDAVIRK
jgi:outer membrane protein OmpA-like peptidoglycan-associated protein